MTVKEAAVYLNLSESHIIKLINRGALQAVKESRIGSFGKYGVIRKIRFWNIDAGSLSAFQPPGRTGRPRGILEERGRRKRCVSIACIFRGQVHTHCPRCGIIFKRSKEKNCTICQRELKK